MEDIGAKALDYDGNSLKGITDFFSVSGINTRLTVLQHCDQEMRPQLLIRKRVSNGIGTK